MIACSNDGTLGGKYYDGFIRTVVPEYLKFISTKVCSIIQSLAVIRSQQHTIPMPQENILFCFYNVHIIIYSYLYIYIYSIDFFKIYKLAPFKKYLLIYIHIILEVFIIPFWNSWVIYWKHYYETSIFIYNIHLLVCIYIYIYILLMQLKCHARLLELTKLRKRCIYHWCTAVFRMLKRYNVCYTLIKKMKSSNVKFQ